jgi:ribosomal protein S18 acetylase RimI-like enzyme
VRISVVDEDLLERLLPLIEDYQRFYRVEQIDHERNRSFFRQFVERRERGILHAVETEEGVVGFSTLYFSYSSALAAPIAVLNDLFVKGQCRGRGFGRALIEHAATYARDNGYARLQWLTAEDNRGAQGLYDRTAARRSTWFLYSLPLNTG